MTPKLPFTVRWNMWWHEALYGHRLVTRHRRGKLNFIRCPHCWKTFLWNRL